MTDEESITDKAQKPISDEPWSESSAARLKDSGPQTGIRWWIAVIIIVAAAVAHAVAWFWVGDNLSLRSLANVLPWIFASLLLVLWWVLLSGARWRTRLSGVEVLAAALILFVAMFRWEGQAGDFVPHFGFRFLPSAEERAVDFFESHADDAASADQSTQLDVTVDDWPRFGGANEDHIVTDALIRRDWNENPPRALWRQPIGPGWSSFAVVGGYAFTQEQRGENEAVVCYDADTGKQLWLHTDKARCYDAASGTGPRATPTIHDSRLFALGGTGILNCLNAVTGDLHWTTNIIEDAETRLIEWGMAGSPLIYEDMVIVNPGGRTAAVIAYDQRTGEQRWAGGGDRATYASPQIAELDGVPQILIYCATGLCGHDVTSGEKLWSFPWTNLTKLNIAQPIVLPDKSVFISSGYGGGSALLDISQNGSEWKVEPRWTRPNKFRLKFNGGIYRDGFVYGLDEGILSCFDLSIGKKTWKRGRYNFGQIVMVGDDVLVSAESGRVVLVEVSPHDVHEVASFQAIEGKTWNHPVVNRGRLYIRNGEEAACYDLSL
jgi:outer membrane protein assembly factor BamB